MAAKKGGLGKGLDSLITDKVSKTVAAKTEEKNEKAADGIMVNINKVEPNLKHKKQKNKDGGFNDI